MTEAMDQSSLYLHWEDAELSAAEILRRVRDLIAFGWCQGADATDAAGHPVDPWSAHACHWSLPGALALQLATVSWRAQDRLAAPSRDRCGAAER
jgi:hypothetical protein